MGRHDDEEEFSQKEVLFTAALLYYEKDRSQAQIAEELGVSKATVSRLLARAREAGIVKIELIPSPSIQSWDRPSATGSA